MTHEIEVVQFSETFKTWCKGCGWLDRTVHLTRESVDLAGADHLNANKEA